MFTVFTVFCSVQLLTTNLWIRVDQCQEFLKEYWTFAYAESAHADKVQEAVKVLQAIPSDESDKALESVASDLKGWSKTLRAASTEEVEKELCTYLQNLCQRVAGDSTNMTAKKACQVAKSAAQGIRSSTCKEAIKHICKQLDELSSKEALQTKQKNVDTAFGAMLGKDAGEAQFNNFMAASRESNGIFLSDINCFVGDNKGETMPLAEVHCLSRKMGNDWNAAAFMELMDDIFFMKFLLAMAAINHIWLPINPARWYLF